MKLQINESLKIEVFARKYWNETNIEFEVGEVYHFTANGIWSDAIIRCDARGYTCSYINLFSKWKRNKLNNVFALIGSIDKHSDFLIGSLNNLTVLQKGTFYCYANDIKGFYWNNFGCVELTIRRIQ